VPPHKQRFSVKRVVPLVVGVVGFLVGWRFFTPNDIARDLSSFSRMLLILQCTLPFSLAGLGYLLSREAFIWYDDRMARLRKGSAAVVRKTGLSLIRICLIVLTTVVLTEVYFSSSSPSPGSFDSPAKVSMSSARAMVARDAAAKGQTGILGAMLRSDLKDLRSEAAYQIREMPVSVDSLALLQEMLGNKDQAIQYHAVMGLSRAVHDSGFKSAGSTPQGPSFALFQQDPAAWVARWRGWLDENGESFRKYLTKS
jgi:hypothetical protein